MTSWIEEKEHAKNTRKSWPNMGEKLGDCDTIHQKKKVQMKNWKQQNMHSVFDKSVVAGGEWGGQ